MNMPNRPLTRLLFAQGGLCFFCSKSLPLANASVEHLVASSNGGRDQDDNCVVCCKSLNVLLGSRSLKEKIQVVLNQKGQFECPNGKVKKASPKATKSTPKVTKATKSTAERYAQVVADLKRRGNKKPRTIVKLNNMISALFQKKLSQREVDALVQQLESQRRISIVQSKLTYIGF
jgi:HNH endonuclease